MSLYLLQITGWIAYQFAVISISASLYARVVLMIKVNME